MADRDRLCEWRRTLRLADRMADPATPPVLRAHFVVKVLLPRLAALIGPAEVATQLADLLAGGLCAWTGRCRNCKTADATDRVTGYCPACLAAFDQFTAEVEAEEGGPDDAAR